MNSERVSVFLWRIFEAAFLVACFVIVARAVWHSLM